MFKYRLRKKKTAVTTQSNHTSNMLPCCKIETAVKAQQGDTANCFSESFCSLKFPTLCNSASCHCRMMRLCAWKDKHGFKSSSSYIYRSTNQSFITRYNCEHHFCPTEELFCLCKSILREDTEQERENDTKTDWGKKGAWSQRVRRSETDRGREMEKKRDVERWWEVVRSLASIDGKDWPWQAGIREK